MSDLFTPATQDWVDNAMQRYSKGIYGKLVSAVIWSDERSNDGEFLVPADPIELVAKISKELFILLDNHDPGRPKGRILEGANFESKDGRKFVAAILGYYKGGEVLDFQGLGFDKEVLAPSPKSLPVLSDDAWIEFATDPREVDAEWLDLVTSNAPLQIKRIECSHNALDFLQELIISLETFMLQSSDGFGSYSQDWKSDVIRYLIYIHIRMIVRYRFFFEAKM